MCVCVRACVRVGGWVRVCEFNTYHRLTFSYYTVCIKISCTRKYLIFQLIFALINFKIINSHISSNIRKYNFTTKKVNLR